jgi:type IV pilus assembly protein PilA
MLAACTPLLLEGTKALLVVLFLQIPYVLILRELRSESRRRGLALATGWGLLAITYLALVSTSSSPRDEVALLWWSLLTLAALPHVALVVSALKTLRTMRGDPLDRRALRSAIVKRAVIYPASILIGVSLVLYLVYLNLPEPQSIGRNENSAISSLRSMVAAQLTYASTYPELGFASTLSQLGPPPPEKEPDETAANLIDAQLASGIKSGYRFVLRPGPRDAEGIIQTFTISARPLEYKRTGYSSFFTDESGVIRRPWEGKENRPANAEDPPVG